MAYEKWSIKPKEIIHIRWFRSGIHSLRRQNDERKSADVILFT